MIRYIHVTERDESEPRPHVGFGSLWALIGLGIQLLLLGILIIVFPEILAWILGGLLVIAGGAALWAAWKLRRLRRPVTAWRDAFRQSPPFP